MEEFQGGRSERLLVVKKEFQEEGRNCEYGRESRQKLLRRETKKARDTQRQRLRQPRESVCAEEKRKSRSRVFGRKKLLVR